jgi:plastocyanin
VSRRRLVPALVAAALLALVAVPVAGAGPAKGPKVVKVRDNFYSPTKVKITKNHRVKWAWGNSNVNSHDVTLKKGPKRVRKRNFRSITGAVGITFEKKFKVPGTYRFFCTIHANVMKMEVVVKR